jgi:ketosteroid isomerase-like protein
MSLIEIARSYEKALFAGDWDALGRHFTDDVVYWIAGAAPLGGEWHGRDDVVRAFRNREFGLGDADWAYEEVWREWAEAGDRVIVEIRERSWLKHAPDDRIDQRTCVTIRMRGDRICEMRDYTDTHVYEQFLARHPELPRARSRA